MNLNKIRCLSGLLEGHSSEPHLSETIAKTGFRQIFTYKLKQGEKRLFQFLTANNSQYNVLEGFKVLCLAFQVFICKDNFALFINNVSYSVSLSEMIVFILSRASIDFAHHKREIHKLSKIVTL